MFKIYIKLFDLKCAIWYMMDYNQSAIDCNLSKKSTYNLYFLAFTSECMSVEGQ